MTAGWKRPAQGEEEEADDLPEWHERGVDGVPWWEMEQLDLVVL